MVNPITLLLAAAASAHSLSQRSAPPTYVGCVYDPSVSAAFQLLDSKTYLPVSRDSDDAVVLGPVAISPPSSPSEPQKLVPQNQQLLEFHAANLDAQGVHDIALTTTDGSTLYLALVDGQSGKLGWVDEPDVSFDDDTRTHIFTTLCTGEIIVRLGSTAFNETTPELAIAVDDDTHEITLIPALSSSPHRMFFVLPHRVRTSLLVVHSREDSYKSTSTSGPPRCASPMHAVPRPSSPEVVPNGCGTASINVPEFNFGDCCNAHDVCFSTCDATFGGCNDVFEHCMYERCDVDYSGDWEFVPLAACKAGAFFYASSVKLAGEGAFMAATADQCDCV